MGDTIHVLDCGYKIHEVCEAFNIPRNILKDHYNGRFEERKIGPKCVLTKEEEEKLVAYVVEMARLAHPLISNDLKLKVAEICQTKYTFYRWNSTKIMITLVQKKASSTSFEASSRIESLSDITNLECT